MWDSGVSLWDSGADAAVWRHGDHGSATTGKAREPDLSSPRTEHQCWQGLVLTTTSSVLPRPFSTLVVLLFDRPTVSSVPDLVSQLSWTVYWGASRHRGSYCQTLFEHRIKSVNIFSSFVSGSLNFKLKVDSTAVSIFVVILVELTNTHSILIQKQIQRTTEWEASRLV